MSKSYSKELYSTASGERWKRIGAKRRAGVLVPLFSVYSQKSLSIGDLGDLKLIIDWCKKIGNSILQLLPMNEIGSTFCPYDALSSFALEPAYLSFENLSFIKKGFRSKIKDTKKKFPGGRSHVDYGIKKAKVKLLRDLYIEEGFDSKDKEFKIFLEENGCWIDDFALFKVLKDYHEGRPWYEWEDNYRYGDSASLDVFRREHEKEITFQKWMQWLLFNQFKGVKDFAESKDILLKGDLPILISRDSADVWAHQEFFKLEFAAGAPPDMYCAKGQRWGMPTYNWERISEDGYRYLKEKLKYAENFYDLLRIDHVVGLFRIWSIPYDNPLENEGLGGFFDPIDENRWEDHGMQILSEMLDSTKMLLCAEDLGIIPKSCPETLEKLGIPGNDVQRWTKDWQVSHDFKKPEDYRLLSTAMLSTHDTTNWAAWWENEAGTVDQDLFLRKTMDRGINYDAVKDALFDPVLSRHGRLRWRKSVTSSEVLTDILGKPKEKLADFIDMYENTYMEKEKLWKHLNMRGPMREKCDPEILREALNITLASRSVFCIELLVDYLNLANIFKGDPYNYRVNRPGTITKDNWSLVIPMSLEKLLTNKVCDDIKEMVNSGDRI